MRDRRGAQTRAGRLRRWGVRVSAGSWTACGEKARAGEGRLIVALGRAAGSATTRSRIRRIAREIFAARPGRAVGVDLLLMARGDVSRQPRRQVRAGLGRLFERLAARLARRERETDSTRHAGHPD